MSTGGAGYEPGMLEPDVRKLAEGPNLGVITTLLPDGQAQTQPIWVDAEDDHLVVNTQVDRVKYRNLQRDGRVTLTIVDSDNPYHYAEVRGEVEGFDGGDEARRHLDELSEKYKGEPYDPSRITADRVKVRISPRRQRVYG